MFVKWLLNASAISPGEVKTWFPVFTWETLRHVQYSFQFPVYSGVGSFRAHKYHAYKSCRTYGFSSLSEKTTKYNYLRREHFLLSHLKTLSVMLVRPGFEPATSRSANRHSPDWANQTAELKKLGTLLPYYGNPD